MAPLLNLSRLIDRGTEWIGRWLAWLVLAAVLISAINAAVRKAFNTSSNAYLAIQWYLFAAVFLLAAGYTMLRQEHVKIDVISGRFSKRTQIWIDIAGDVLFLLPAAALIGWMSWPIFLNSYQIGEHSPNAGGLLRWPIKLVVPLGCLLLFLQGLSELVKRAGALTGHCQPPPQYVNPLQ